jgi:hypothetical protein
VLWNINQVISSFKVMLLARLAIHLVVKAKLQAHPVRAQNMGKVLVHISRLDLFPLCTGIVCLSIIATPTFMDLIALQC